MDDFNLREMVDADLANLIKYANNPNIAKNLKNAFPNPYTPENGKAFIELAKKDKPTQVFCICRQGELIGVIYIGQLTDIYCKNAEIGYWLAEPFWGQGVMTKAVTKILQYGFAALPVERVFAKVFFSNEASKKVLEKNGFILEAQLKKTIFKNGTYIDEFIYAAYR